MVKHIVMWNIQEGLDKVDTFNSLKEKLEALTKDIDFLLKIEVGMNFTKNATCRDIVLYTEFANQEDLANYLIHPAHVAVGAYVRSVVCDRVDVDCEL